jgi:hypothetical protein
MALSESAARLKVAIEKAIEDHKITDHEWETIRSIALEDHVIDNQERALLQQLQNMIEDGSVKLTGNK